MPEMEFRSSFPELPKQDDLPDWITAPINEAVGFDRYAGIDKDLDLDGLRVELLMLELKLDEFNDDIKDVDKVNKLATAEGDRLVKFYENMALKIQRIKERSQNIKATAQPKLHAVNERKGALEQAIRIKEQAARQAALYDQLMAKFQDIASKMPWKDIAMPHQLDGSSRMAYNRRCILGDDVGLGKTLTSIMTAANIQAKTAEGDANDVYDYFAGNFDQPPAGRRVLYLVPAALDTNIRKEFKKWTTKNPIFLSKQPRNGRRLFLEALKDGPDVVVILNYEAWRRDKQLINDLIEFQFDTIFMDEAHTLKERDSAAYRGVAHLLHGRDFTSEARESLKTGDPYLSPHLTQPDGTFYRRPRYIYPMTGTPILNRPQEFYTLLTLVNHEEFPPTKAGEANFLNIYAYRNKMGRWMFDSDALKRLSEEISHLYLKRTLKDAGIKLPPQDLQIHEIPVDEELYPSQAKARNDMREYALLMLEDKIGSRAKNGLVVRMRLRQIETLPSGIKFVRVDDWGNEYDDAFNVKESQKLDYIIKENGQGWEGLLPEVCPEQRTVIYSQFKEPLRELHRRATDAGLRSVILDGDTLPELAEHIKQDVDRFYVEERGGVYDYDVVFANYKVGGQGLNLTHVTQTIICDEEWNPGRRDQAYGRTNRMGQTEDTTVHVLRMTGTIDMWMSELIAGKEEMIEQFNTKNALIEALRKGDV